MKILVKRKVQTYQPVPVPQTIIPERREKVNWDPYYQKCKVSSRKERKKMAVQVKANKIAKEVKVKKEEVKKAKGLTIDDVWYKVLHDAVGKGLTDQAIADQMNKTVDVMGKKHTKYTEKQVAGHRSGYNNGRFPCQKGIKPSAKLVRFELKKEKQTPKPKLVVKKAL